VAARLTIVAGIIAAVRATTGMRIIIRVRTTVDGLTRIATTTVKSGFAEYEMQRPASAGLCFYRLEHFQD
jgi:hypothetical protein